MSTERTAWLTIVMHRRRFLRLTNLGAGVIGARLLGDARVLLRLQPRQHRALPLLLVRHQLLSLLQP
ncbi:MAG: hypothetical protein ACK42I_04735, partial [Thermomicrobium sp.]